MVRRTVLCLIVLAALAAAPAGAAGGPGPFAVQGGLGVLSRDGSTRFLVMPANGNQESLLELVSTKDASVQRWVDIRGSYGIPTIAYGSGGDSLSHDGRSLVLATTSSPPSSFLVYDTRTLGLRNMVTLPGMFAFDALSPDGRRMYLIQYTLAKYGDLAHYIVRAYDLRTHTLLPGRIADKTQKSWVMDGYPLTRTSSVDGRWVYTLYQNGGNGYPFIHALDTVRGVAHCVGLPIAGGELGGLYNIVLSLRRGTLAVHWRSGRPFLDVNTATWRVTPATRSLPWLWIALGAAALLLLLVVSL
ncbi:MAG: hypothetical protein ACYDCH_14430, partial [Gaiellaceae bacterium]